MSEYVVVVEKAEKNYAAYSPDLPGCAVTGDTKEEALKAHAWRHSAPVMLAATYCLDVDPGP